MNGNSVQMSYSSVLMSLNNIFTSSNIVWMSFENDKSDLMKSGEFQRVLN